MAAHVPSLPDNVIAEILSRLPPRAIGRSRAVCRSWNAIASHPTTADRVLAALPPTVAAIIKDSSGRRWWLDEITGRRVPVDAVRFDRFRGRWHPEVHRKEPCPRALALDDMTISAESFRSWDGVLCARVFPRNQQAAGEFHLLWNPLTDACAVVPAPAAGGRVIGGYAHPVTGRFHLLHSSGAAAHLGRRGLQVAPVTAVRVLAVGDAGGGGGAGWRKVPLPKSETRIAMRGEVDRAVSLHGNLHWLVQRGSGPRKNSSPAAAALLVFDTVREEFRLMAAPERPGLDPATARLRVAPGGKLCVLALSQSQQPPLALEVWVLDGYSDVTRRWRLRETVGLHGGAGLSPATRLAVEVVEGVHEGEEIFIQLCGWMIAYSFRSRVWRHVSVVRSCAGLLLHRESVVPPKTSFGNALRGFRSGRAAPAKSRTFWDICQGGARVTSANIPLEWSAIKPAYRPKFSTMA